MKYRFVFSKTFLSVMLALGLGLSSVGRAPAQSNFTVTIPDTLTGITGDTVRIPIFLEGFTGTFDNYFFTLFFNDSVLSYVDAIIDSTITAPLGTPIVQHTTASGKISGGPFPGPDSVRIDTTKKALFLILRFRVDGAPGQCSDLHFGKFELSRFGTVIEASITKIDGKLCVIDTLEERLIIGTKVVAPGTNNNRLDIFLENSRSICGLQFRFTFDPAVLAINDITTTPRTVGWEVETNIPGNPITVLLFHIPNDSLLPGQEAILSIDFDVRGNAPFADTSHVELLSATATDCDGNRIPISTQDGFVVFGIKGDLNADGLIDLLDLDLLVDIILFPEKQTPFTQWAGDLDNNNVLDIVDVVLLNNLIHGGSSVPLLAAHARAAAPVLALRWGEVSAAGNGYALPLLAVTGGEVKGFQFEIRFADFAAWGIPEMARLPQGMRLASARSGNVLRVLVFGTGDAALPQGEWELFRFGMPAPMAFTPTLGQPITADARGRYIDLGSAPQAGDGGGPATFRLFPSFPNPFREATTLRFELAEPGEVQIEIYDVLGRRVASFARRNLPPGQQHFRWDGRNANGRRVGPGVYWVRVCISKMSFQQVIVRF